MKINYIILAHKNPKQLRRLILSLSDAATNFYVHIDKNSEINPFRNALEKCKNVLLLEDEARIPIIWGDISVVKATLNVLHKISLKKKNDYCILLSGQDYPLRSPDSIRTFLEKNIGNNFITLFSLPNPIWKQGGLNRLNRYKINKSSSRKHFLFLSSFANKEFYSLETLGKLNFLMKNGRFHDFVKVFNKRIFPKYLEPFGGPQWWALTTETIQKILVFLEDHPDYVKYHYYTLIPDEIFFHSILADLNKRDPIEVSPSLTYANWLKESGPLPVTFEKQNFPELVEAAKENLFARKFDIVLDSEILNMIDNLLIDH